LFNLNYIADTKQQIKSHSNIRPSVLSSHYAMKLNPDCVVHKHTRKRARCLRFTQGDNLYWVTLIFCPVTLQCLHPTGLLGT